MTTLSHKIRLNPTEEQIIYFKKACGVVRFAYNWGLAEWTRRYEVNEKTSAMQLKKEFNAIKGIKFPFCGEVSGRCTEYGFSCLGKAFVNFFDSCKGKRPEMGYPKFRSKHKSKPTFYVSNQELKFDGFYTKLPVIGWVNMAEQLRFQGKINSGVVSFDANHWWLSVSVQVDEETLPKHNPQGAVGIDLGIKTHAVLSDGTVYENQRHLSQLEKALRRANKELSRRVQGSSHWQKTKEKLARIHYKIRCQREDTIHKMTTEITRKYALIGVEDLNVKGMMSNRRLAKAVSQVSFFEVKRQLDYKAKMQGGAVVQIGRFFASSKLCSSCGNKFVNLVLANREWTCEACGVIHDRDSNASINILNEALRIKAGGVASQNTPKTAVDTVLLEGW